MTTEQKISIADWSESQNPINAEKRPPPRFWRPGLIGLVGTLLLHSLVLQTVVLGIRAQKVRPPEVKDGSSLNKRDAQPADALVFIELSKIAKTTDEIDESLASVRASIKDSPIPATHPDPSPLRNIDSVALSEDSDSDSESSVDNGDGAERARMFGIYSGQIQARVERVWRRPRTPVEEGSDSAKTAKGVEYFRCQVQIVQDSIGNVREILLPNCNGSAAWQRSLVIAIQQASPLPAPPSRTVFSHRIGLNFTGYAYAADSSDDEYETLPSTEQASMPSVRPPQIVPDLHGSIAPERTRTPSAVLSD